MNFFSLRARRADGLVVFGGVVCGLRALQALVRAPLSISFSFVRLFVLLFPVVPCFFPLSPLQMVAGINAQLEEHRAAKARQEAEDKDFAEYQSALLHEVQVAELEQQRSELLERLRVANENKKLVRCVCRVVSCHVV